MDRLTPVFLGDVKLENRIFYAPLAGCSDYPFRQMSSQYRPGLMHCEMVKMDALVRNDPYTFQLLEYDTSMHPIAAQLCGSKVPLAAPCARIIEDLGFDVLDLNCGCPVDKVTKDGSGSGLLRNIDLIGEIIEKMVHAVSIPVTVKIRAGWDESSICATEITKIAEQAGAKAITIHGRTRVQAYKGSANWDHIRDAKSVAKKILVVGNGDVFDANAALRMFDHTNCDAILVSRGTMGQPWIVEDILRKLQGKDPILRSSSDTYQSLLQHFDYILRYRNERQALLDFRRVGCWYLKKWENVKTLRLIIQQANHTKEVLSAIQSLM